MVTYLTTHEIAARLNVHVETVRRWLRTKELRGIPFGNAGYRVTEADFQNFLERRQDSMPVLVGAAEQQRRQRNRRAAPPIRTASAERVQELEAIFEAMTDAVFILNERRGPPRMNRAGRALLALPVDEPLSISHEPPFVLLDENDQPLPPDAWPEARLRQGETLAGDQAVDVRLQTRDGRIRSLSVTGAPLRYPDGRVSGAVLVCRDVTERRSFEQQSQQALEALLMMAEEMVQIPDESEGELSVGYNAPSVSQRLTDLICRVLACKRASITAIDPATHALRSVAVAGLTAEQEQQWRARQSGAVLHEYLADPALEQILLERDSLVLDLTQPPYNAKLAPFGIQTLLLVSMTVGTRQVGILALDHGEDAHVYSADEETLAKAVAKLAALVLERERLLKEQAESLAKEQALRDTNQRMDEFIGVASHELRTPLTTIKMTLQIIGRRLSALQEEASDEEQMSKLTALLSLVTRAEYQAERQQRLMNDLLDVSRIQAGKLEYRMERWDLVAMARSIIEDQQHLNPLRPILLTATIKKATIWADVDRISQVINNYLTNALKYSDASLPVTMTIARRGADVYVTVLDKGPGLSAETQQHIWERFYRAAGVKEQASTTGGLGLGLYICRMIIDAHHGQVGVISTEGEGATFWFTLPLADKQGAN